MKSEQIEAAVEMLSEIEHERWSRWQKYLHKKCVPNDDGSLTIPVDLVDKWEKQMNTPYKELSDKEKDSDRELVLDKFHLLDKIFNKS
ncbi:hypothetical protein [Pantoea agglomerans]|uniref:hypothetical protein n=1 Tax=Enterobacter agglomerans TaxID=549 RepID=UPI0021D7B3C3|nr:hypothetical protein [Pantoea agglomerans]